MMPSALWNYVNHDVKCYFSKVNVILGYSTSYSTVGPLSSRFFVLMLSDPNYVESVLSETSILFNTFLQC